MSLENSSNFLRIFSSGEMRAAGMSSYRFNTFVLNVGERRLLDRDRPVALTPKVFDTLVYLVQNAGHLVEKDAVMKAVWSDSFVEEGNLARTIHTLRKALGQDDNGNKFIETVPTKGYRFVADVAIESEVRAEREHKQDSAIDVGNEDLPFPLSVESDLPRPTAHFASSTNGFPWVLVGFGGVIVFAVAAWAWSGSSLASSAAYLSGKKGVTSNRDAYFSYQEGVLLLEKRDHDDRAKALELFDRAIQLDPNFADAHARRAAVLQWQFYSTRAPDDMAQARTAVEKALELDTSSSFAHLTLCRMKVTYDWDFRGGEKACRTAVELDPNLQDAHFELAMLHSMYGRVDEALAEIDRAIEIAPTSFNKRSRGFILFYARRYDEAIEQMNDISENDPEFLVANAVLMRSFEMKGDFDKTLEFLNARLRFLKKPQEMVDEVTAKYETEGWPGVLKIMITDIEGSKNTGGLAMGPVHLAALYCRLGDFEKAFEMLESGFKQRNIWMIHLARDPRFDAMRSDPRYAKLLQRIGLNDR